MNNKNSSINFILPELEEFKTVSSPLHFWAIAVSDSKFVIFLCGVEEYGGGVGAVIEFSKMFDRKSEVNNLIGTDIEELIVKKKIKYVFNRGSDSPIKFKLFKKWGGALKLLLEDDTKIVEEAMGYNPKITLRPKQLEKIKQAIPELEVEYVKELPVT